MDSESSLMGFALCQLRHTPFIQIVENYPSFILAIIFYCLNKYREDGVNIKSLQSCELLYKLSTFFTVYDIVVGENSIFHSASYCVEHSLMHCTSYCGEVPFCQVRLSSDRHCFFYSMP